MSTVRSSRRIERAGVNALRALLEEHDHIVQEMANFTLAGKRTPYWIATQVKSGKKHKRVNGCAIPVDDHFDDWRQDRIAIADVRRFITRVQNVHMAASAKEAHRVLCTALTAGVREELITRNVASLVEPPRVKQREIRPWTLEETLSFLEPARRDRRTPRSGWPLPWACGAVSWWARAGLTWTWVTAPSTSGSRPSAVGATLYDDGPKSRRSRVVPLPALCIAPLRWHRLRQRETFARTGVAWSETGYVFAT